MRSMNLHSVKSRFLSTNCCGGKRGLQFFNFTNGQFTAFRFPRRLRKRGRSDHPFCGSIASGMSKLERDFRSEAMNAVHGLPPMRDHIIRCRRRLEFRSASLRRNKRMSRNNEPDFMLCKKSQNIGKSFRIETFFIRKPFMCCGTDKTIADCKSADTERCKKLILHKSPFF